jgi:hypothetical protein
MEKYFVRIDIVAITTIKKIHSRNLERHKFLFGMVLGPRPRQICTVYIHLVLYIKKHTYILHSNATQERATRQVDKVAKST